MGETARVYRMDGSRERLRVEKRRRGKREGGRAGSRPMRRNDAAVD